MGRYGKLIDPKQGPSDLRLQAGALRSLQGVLPLGAVLPGSYRSNAQQAALYARDQNRYAPPGKSLHEYGLAIDVNSGYLASHPEVRQALLARGWYQERPDEPWHFSYGFFSTPATTSGQGPRRRGRPRRRTRTPANTARQRI